MPSKKAMGEILQHFLKHELKNVDQLIIVAKTKDGELVMMNNQLTFDEIFALLKLADIEAVRDYKDGE